MTSRLQKRAFKSNFPKVRGFACSVETHNVRIWLQDHRRLPQANASSDTDDNSPPKEPVSLPPSCRRIRSSPGRFRKIFPSTIPSHNVGLNYVSAVPSYLRRPLPRRPPILDPIYRKKQTGKKNSSITYEKLPDSSSDDDTDFGRSYGNILASSHKRPKSAPGTGKNTPRHRRSESRYQQEDSDYGITISAVTVSTLESARPLLEAILRTDDSFDSAPTDTKVSERKSRMFNRSQKSTTKLQHVYRTASRTTLQSTSSYDLKSEDIVGKPSLGKSSIALERGKISKSDTKVVSSDKLPDCLNLENDSSIKTLTKTSKASLVFANGEKKVSISSSDSVLQRVIKDCTAICEHDDDKRKSEYPPVGMPIPLRRKMGKMSHRKN